MTTIDNVTEGEFIPEAWGNAVADFLNGCVEAGSYTPTLVNCSIGTGGNPINSAIYRYVGGPAVGDTGLLFVSHLVNLGTTGSVSGTITMTLPPGFNAEFSTANNNNRPPSAVHIIAGGITAMGAMLRQGDNVMGYQVLNASATYLGFSNIGASVPGTWAAGDSLRSNFVVPVVRV